MDEAQKHIFVLILCGGGGTRLWPVSRDSFPKQFIPLFEGKSLFKLTVERALKITTKDKIFISTSHKYRALIKEQVKGIPDENIIYEPIRRDTAFAHGLGALMIYKRDPNAVIVNFASDHLISPVENLKRDLLNACDIAYNNDKVVTIGIKPTYPHTGLGHIKASLPFSSKTTNALKGEKFIEKPPLELAKKYTDSGKYYWNANLYVWKAKVLLDLLKKHSKKTVAFFPKISQHLGTDTEKQVIQMAFQMAPSISIDYAVSEKLSTFVCVPASFKWTDVGYWDVVWQNLPKDNLGNVISGPRGKAQYIGINSKNNLLFLDKKLVATVGLQDMMIVDTPDALLICPKSDAQGVKQVVQMIKEQSLEEYL